MTHKDAKLLLAIAKRLDLDWQLHWYTTYGSKESTYYIVAGHGINELRIYSFEDGIRLAANEASYNDE